MLLLNVRTDQNLCGVEGKEITLRPGDKLSIRAGTEHKALNHEKALMASHGIGDTETLNRICEDNGDVQS